LMDAGVGACLADDMGLGKTLQVIALLVALLRRQDPGPHLVIVPASLMTNWQREFERFAPTVDVRVVHGGDAELGDPVAYVTIASYGTVLRNKALQGHGWGLVVLDEAQEIKNPRSQISQAVKRLSTRMRICLSGTPIENHLLDLWSIMDFLNPGLLGTEPDFRTWCREHLTDTDVTPLRQRVSPFILRRLKTDPVIALDLPQKVEVTVYCGMTAAQSDRYGRTYANMLAEFAAADSAGRQGIAFKVLLRLKQICDHPDLVDGGRFDPRLSGKFIRLAEIAATIAERGEKVLVFTQFKEMTGPIAEHLEAVTNRSGAILDGDLPVKRRQEIVEEFQTGGRLSFLVLTFGVGGTGFNLTAACHVVLFDRWWNPAVENQAMDRAFRIGQTKGVVVHKFVCRGTLEERIDQLIQRKHELAKGLFASDSGPDGGLGRLSPDELLSLAALDPSLASIDER
ncbi:MAG TPA: DEAD/DEAH box helicase, partial [Nannocystaceae bacterium]|nr:DEAD/DEAH box helicase [Nannocystaceae bacterium]